MRTTAPESAHRDPHNELQRRGFRSDAAWLQTLPNVKDEHARIGAEDGEAVEEAEEGAGAKLRLKAWDRAHKLMQLWRASEQAKVDDYIEARGLKRDALFHRILQVLLADAGSDERAILESLSNHLAAPRGHRHVLPNGPARL